MVSGLVTTCPSCLRSLCRKDARLAGPWPLTLALRPCPASPPSPNTFPTCRPTPAATELLEKIIYRVETENGWDQALFNECIFFPNRPGYKVGGRPGAGAGAGDAP